MSKDLKGMRENRDTAKKQGKSVSKVIEEKHKAKQARKARTPAMNARDNRR
jgi:hypothetical protein